MRMRLLILLVFTSFFSLSQKDSIQEIDEVNISFTRIRNFLKSDNSLNESEIKELRTNDVGELLQKFSGTSLRSYGGLGGLKTISVRSLGASHVSIVEDGFTNTNTQTGQVNLGAIHTNNLISASSVSRQQSTALLPASSLVMGSSFLLETFENSFAKDTFSARVGLEYGSFNRYGVNGTFKYQPSKFFVSCHGAYQSSSGNYPYEIDNGLTVINDSRKNNDYLDYQFGLTSGYQFNSFNKIRFGIVLKEMNQGLPGAVVFYNLTQDERMKTSEKSGFLDFYHSKGRWHYRIFSKGRINNLIYDDPDYLNNEGSLHSEYLNESINGGLTAIYSLSKRLSLNAGVEETFSTLSSDHVDFTRPERFHSYGLIGAVFDWRVKSMLQLSLQYVNEQYEGGIAAKNQLRINPYIQFEWEMDKVPIKHEFWYRNSFRMPSFNELYYNNIGNKSLLPEDAHQFNYGLSAKHTSSKLKLKVSVNAFYNIVQNKIVAIPTKNLFVWSMQNVGSTEIYGVEVQLHSEISLATNWKIALDGNYTFQRAIDRSDKLSPTYGHQLAYTPAHTSNLLASIGYKSAGLKWTTYFNSYRYTLNENVSQNLLDGFLVSDLSVFYKFDLVKEQNITLQFNVRNIFNSSYAYIRSFVMPGRNFLISLSYALN